MLGRKSGRELGGKCKYSCKDWHLFADLHDARRLILLCYLAGQRIAIGARDKRGINT